MANESPTERSRVNALHWRWFRRLLGWVFVFSLAVFAVALGYMVRSGVEMRWQLVAALGLGITASLMLGAALMGLVFVSSRTGVDDDVADLPGGDHGEEH